jgi:acyl transferase domain-containing protein/NADPH:quinone reductase-like Zn-dependent oxidoreductase/thioesterase domain-containing protein/acyl carrier protein
LAVTTLPDDPKLIEYFKRVTSDLYQTREQLRAVEERDTEPIAIVGMACRLPGGVSSPEQMWRLLVEETDAVSEFPEGRGWDNDRLYDPDPDHTGTSYVREGGFLHDADEFDAAFFGISPKEAAAMDPQQRLLLETAWEALEHARIDPTTLRGSRTGVFTGVTHNDYVSRLGRAPDGFEGQLLTGGAASVASGRVSYTFGFEGPSIAVDTACSSSLVALHQAVRSLRQNESTLALAGGVTVMATPMTFVEFSRQRGLARDARAKSFAAGADGTSMSEGAGWLVLERLSEARRHGHRVLAVVRGSAVNSDGASNGLTAPSGPAQQRVIRRALAEAGLSAGQVDAVEAHGTGTALGDPIEAQALIATYGHDRARPLLVGSVKSNVGHTQAAAGVVGVIKTVLALRHGVLPKTLWAEEPTTEVDWSAGAVDLLTETRPWPDTGQPRRAGVSAFGASGTNAHVVLEQAPGTEAVAEPRPVPAVPLVLSARSGRGLRAQAARLLEWLRAHPESSPVDVGFSLATTRARFDHRAVVVGRDRAELLSGLAALAEGRSAAEAVQGKAGPAEPTVFVFPGQGSQWAGMAAGLLDSSPVFAEEFRACADALAPWIDWSCEDALRGSADAPSLERVDVVQPLLWAVMVSLAALWRAHGVEPAAVIGHSQGEIAAAAVAGALSRPDAAKVVALRSLALRQIAGSGGMLSVQLRQDELERRLEPWGDGLSVAAVNGPNAVVVSGELAALDEVEQALTADGVTVRRLPVDYAAHSAQVEPLRQELEAAVGTPVAASSGVAFFSTVDGERHDPADLDREYWYHNLRKPVRFDQGARAALAWGARLFVEVSPHPVLTMSVQDTIDEVGADAVTFGTLRRDQDEPTRFLLALAEAYVHGARIDWARVFDGSGARAVDLPTYAFQRASYWLAGPAPTGDATSVGLLVAGHPLVSAVVALPDSGGLLLTGRLSARTHPWLADHAVLGSVVVPGTALLDLAVHAGDQVGCDRVEELTLQAPLVLPNSGGLSLQIVVSAPEEDGQRQFSLYTCPDHRADSVDDEWTCHATGLLAAAPATAPEPLAAWPPAQAERLETDGLYERLAGVGYGYGPVFQGLRAAWRYGADLYAEVALPEQADPSGFGVHPALLDAGLHAVMASAVDTLEQGGAARLPFSWQGVRLLATGATTLRVRLSNTATDSVTVTAFDEAGDVVLTAESLVSREVSAAQVAAPSAGGGYPSLFRPQWAPLTLPNAEAGRGRWAALGETPVTRSIGGSDTAMRPFSDWQPLVDYVAEASAAPDVIVLPLDTRGAAGGEPVPAGVRRLTNETLATVQSWLVDDRFAETRMVVVTRQAMVVDAAERPDPVAAPVWGLLRSAQTENPGRLLLVDTDDADSTLDILPTVVNVALAEGEQQVAIRAGRAFAARLARVGSGERLEPPAEGPWRLAAGAGGTVDDLMLEPAPAAAAPLADGEVRVAVRAAGVNFRDVLMMLGVHRGEAQLGNEGAGVVLETGPGVAGLAPGDRVFGVFAGAFGPVVVTDQRALAHIPDGWTFEQAASVPVAFMTALYGLRDVGGLTEGESVLIHAAAGGVGMAAVQLARHFGAEVYATASPAKWDVVRSLGVDDDHLASSRTLDFRQKFSSGVHLVLNSLAGEFTTASYELLNRGRGRFLEMGVTDVRSADALPGVDYRSFHLTEAGIDRVQQMLRELVELFADGVLTLPPVRSWDVRRAADAFRFMAQARHIGKIVLRLPRTPGPEGTVLVTGAAGMLGALAARHVVDRGARHVVLVSRREAPSDLVADLEAAGAAVTVAACDVADREALGKVLDDIPAAHPLTAVVHTAGAVDDGVVGSLTPQRIEVPMRPKVDGLWNLHELTAKSDLAVFATYSSAAGILGTAGQGGYNAANAFTDALAQLRQAHGLPAVSLAWGPWAPASAMTGHLGSTDRARMSRGGITPFDFESGMKLYDLSLDVDEPLLIPIQLDPASSRHADGTVPVLLRGLVRTSGRRRVSRRPAGAPAADDAVELIHRLAGLPEQDQLAELGELLRREIAAVLGHAAADDIPLDETFRSMGFDSLTAVELRNRVNASTGVRMRVTTVFDYPTVSELAAFVLKSLDVATAADTAVTLTGAARAAGTADDTLVSLYLAAVDAGRAEEGVGLLTSAARLFPRFTDTESAGQVKVATILSGDLRPAMVCVAPPIAPMLNTAYTMLTPVLPERRDVAVLRPLGFAEDEPIPADLQALFGVYGEATLAHAGLDPVVLVGHSSGGWIAHGVAGYLSGIGRPPAATVLLDTYWPGGLVGNIQRQFMRAQAKRFELIPDDGAPLGRQLVAMGGYLGMFDEWTAQQATVPTLLVRAEMYMTGERKPDEVLTAPPGDGTVTDTTYVPGDHFSMMSKHPETTAAAIHEWLEKVV